MNHARLARISLWMFVVLMVATGCAATPSVSTTEVTDVVLSHTPASEALAALEAELENADAATRVEIVALDKEEEAAVLKFQSAALARANANEGDADESEMSNKSIPTEEKVKALLADAKAKRMVAELAKIGMIDQYEAFLTDHPENWYVRHRYAWFLADILMHYEAAEEWELVTKIEPRFPFAYNNLGSLYNHMGRDKESIVLYRKAISLYDKDPTFYTNLAVNYSTHRKEAGELYGWDLPRIFEECIAAYRKALALTPMDQQIAYDIASQYVLAKYFNVTDTADRAITDWRYYLTLELTDNQRGIAYRNIGRINLVEKKDYDEAIVWLKKADAILEGPASKILLERACKEAGITPAPQE